MENKGLIKSIHNKKTYEYEPFLIDSNIRLQIFTIPRYIGPHVFKLYRTMGKTYIVTYAHAGYPMFWRELASE